MAFMGATPIGSFLVGILASSVGVTLTIAIGGMLSLAGVLVFARKFLAGTPVGTDEDLL